MAKVVYARLLSVGEFNSARWVESSNEDYEMAKREALCFAQDGDVVIIGRRDTWGRVEPRMFCRVQKDGSSRLHRQRWRDIGLRELRVAQALVAEQDIPAADAASLVASEVGTGKPWALWNETHDAVLRITASIQELAGRCGDDGILAFVAAYNAIYAA